jgi:ABC-type transport system substrate-binding protein
VRIEHLATSILVLSIIGILLASSIPIPVAAQEEGLFDITMIAPGTANQARRQWAQIVRNAMQQVGIDASVAYLGWGAVFDRVFFAPSEIWDKSFKDGGYDGIFIGQGWTSPNPVANPKSWGYYGDSKFWPPGPNFWHFSDETSNQLMDAYLRSTDPNERVRILQEWQAYMQQNGPDFVIEYDVAHFAMDPAITGFDPTNPYRSHLLGGVDSITYAVPGEPLAFLNDLSFSWYDLPFLAGVNDLPLNYFGGEQVLNAIESYSSAAGGLQWTVSLRQGMNWHDGVEVTADDFVFEIWAQLTPETGTQQLGYVTTVLGEKVTLSFLDGTTVVKDFTPEGGPVREGAVEAIDKYTVRYTLPEIYAIFSDEFFISTNPTGILHLPKHVLEGIPPAEWGSHSFNTGEGSYTITRPDGTSTEWTGPVGSGPYRFKSYDRTTQLVTLEKFDGYWNKAALEAEGMFSATTVKVVFIAEKEPAIAALRNGEVDVLDYNYHFQKDLARFEPAWGRTLLFDVPGLQEFGLNMDSPIWGTGADTPVGRQDPARAKEAANNVRRAIDRLIPRQLIVDNLLDGFGKLGVTWVKPYEIGFDTTLTPTEYSLDEARKYLALAGYDVTGVPSFVESFTPPVIGVVPPAVPGKPVIPPVLAGQSVNLEGRFVNVETGRPFDIPLVLVAQRSADEGQTWFIESTWITKADGSYSVTVTPPGLKGTYLYRVFFPGNTLSPEEWAALVGEQTGEDVAYFQVLPPLWTDYRVTVSTLQDVLPQFATGEQVTSVGESITGLSQETKSAVDAISAQLISLTEATNRLSSDASGQREQISALQGQVSTLTTGLYIAIALVVIVGAAGFIFARRRAPSAPAMPAG